MKLNDPTCPGCGAPVLRSHRCNATSRPMTAEELDAAIAACYAAIRGETAPEPLQQSLPLVGALEHLEETRLAR